MPALKWTEAAIREEAAKYSSKVEFERGCMGAYSAAGKRFPGLLDELFGKSVRWTEEAIRQEAAKYSSKSEFMRGCGSAYVAILKYFPGLIDELFENKYRYWTEAAIREEAAKYSSKVEFEHGCISAYHAAHRLGIIDQLFKNQRRYWDEQSIRQEAAKYSSKVEFQRGCSSAESAARRLGIIDELFENQKRYWDEQSIRQEAAKYSSKVELQRGCTSAYQAAYARFPGILDELFENQRRQWTEEEIRQEAAKYSSKAEFSRESSAYGVALTRFPGLIDELFENQLRYWDEQSIREEASKYSSKIEFHQGCGSAYGAALTRFPGLVDELFENKYRPDGYWTEETVRQEAAKYLSKTEFQRGCSTAYGVARTRFPGLLNELFPEKPKRKIYWTEEAVRQEAAKYSSKAEFQRGCGSAYYAALNRFPGIVDELFENQPKGTDADVFYIWRAGHYEWQGLPVYKFGITSARIGMKRIKSCAGNNKVRATDIKLFHSETAELWEEIFHSTFTVVPDLGFQDGKTEFRACDEADLARFLVFIGEGWREAA